MLERKIRLWRRGARYVQGDNTFIYNDIGNRRYVLSAITLKKSITSEEWRHLGRDLAAEGMKIAIESPRDIAAQCVSLLVIKKSKQRPYDGIQFNRLLGFEETKTPKEAPHIVP